MEAAPEVGGHDGSSQNAEAAFLDVLCVGRCEPLKAAVHGVVLATAAVCTLYNAAAWLKRRQRHLAINAVIYAAAVVWEAHHVRQHLDALPCATPSANPDSRVAA